MGFPSGAANGTQYMTELGVCYKYDSTDNKWYIIGTSIQTGLDHGTLNGLNDNDHPQYLLSGDFRTWTGNYYNVLSGDFSDLSGDFSNLSGDYLTTSGDFSDLSGDFSNLSGDYKDLSGDFSNLSGDYLTTSGVANTALQNVIEDTSPQLGGNLDLNKKSINYSGAFSSDHQYEGVTTSITAVGSFGEGLYMKSNGQYDRADADAEGTMPCSAIWVGANKVLLCGTIRDDTYNFTPGNQVYPNTGAAGKFLSVAPSGTGKFIQRVGVALSADSMYFNPDKTVLELK